MIYCRDEMARYALRSLGAPLIKVNVTDEQINDRIDEALDFFHQYHNEASVRMWMKHRADASILRCEQEDTDVFHAGDKIQGAISGATADVVKYTDGTKSEHGIILIVRPKGEFQHGEPVTVINRKDDEGREIQRNLISEGEHFHLGVFDSHEIEVPQCVLGVTRILSTNTATSSQNLFDVQYQMRLNDLYDITSTSLIYYHQAMEHLELLNFELNTPPSFEFNRHEGKIHVRIKNDYDVSPGDFLVFEVFRALDPCEAPRLWNDRWLKRYIIALIKRQEGINLKKYGGIQLAGGVQLNGDAIYQEAQQEIQSLEDELMNNLPPSCFFIG